MSQTIQLPFKDSNYAHLYGNGNLFNWTSFVSLPGAVHEQMECALPFVRPPLTRKYTSESLGAARNLCIRLIEANARMI